VDEGKISNKIAPGGFFADIFVSGESPKENVCAHQSHPGERLPGSLEKFLRRSHCGPTRKSVEDFKAGKSAALNFLKGQVMKASKGKANPGVGWGNSGEENQ